MAKAHLRSIDDHHEQRGSPRLRLLVIVGVPLWGYGS